MEDEQSNNRCCFPPVGPAPWLVYTHGNAKSKKMQTFCTISSSPPYTQYCFKSIPQLRGKRIFSSNDGWLVLFDLDNFNMFTLWNPISSHIYHLPPLDFLDIDFLDKDFLVCPPSEDDYSGEDVNVFLFVDGAAFSCRPFRDNSSWISHSTELLGQRVMVVKAIICNGVIYGEVHVSSGQLQFPYCYVTIEVNNHASDFDMPLTLRVLPVGFPVPTFVCIFEVQHLLASCGRLYSITIYSRNGEDNRICAVNIWELNLCLMKWVRVTCLDGRAFFLGKKSCTWCWGSTDNSEFGGIKPNSVYFEMSACETFGTLEALYSYNLEDESLTSFLPCPNLPSPWDNPTWVMPQYQRLAKDEAYEHCIRKVGLLKLGSGAIRCQGLQEQNEEHTQHKSCTLLESSDALGLTFDQQKQNDVLDTFVLCELPLDWIPSVSKQMHLFDYMNFRATCKEFRSISPIARWRTNNSYPLLMFFESEEPRCRLMDPCRSDSHFVDIPELYGCTVHIDFSKDGWLLLRTNHGLSLHFFNPFTRVGGNFPSIALEHHTENGLKHSTVGFSSCPTSADCVTVILMRLGESVGIYYHRFGEKVWHVSNFEHDDEGCFEPLVVSSPVYHRGAFYFLDRWGYLGVFRLVNGESTWEVHSKPHTPSDGWFHSRHLVECGGELLSIFIGDMGKWVWVFKLEQRNMKWVRVKSLGNHVLFLGPSSSFSVVAKEREMANRIYLPRRCGDGLVYYALDTGKYSTHMGVESFEDFCGTKEHVRCCWI